MGEFLYNLGIEINPLTMIQNPKTGEEKDDSCAT